MAKRGSTANVPVQNHAPVLQCLLTTLASFHVRSMPSRGPLLAGLNSDVARVAAEASGESDDWVTEEELEGTNKSRSSRSKGRRKATRRTGGSKEKKNDTHEEAEMFIHLMTAMLQAQERQSKKERGSGGSSTASNGASRSSEKYPPWDDSFMMDDPFDDDYDPFEDDILFGDDEEEEEAATPRDLVHWPSMWRLVSEALSVHGDSNDIPKAIEGLLIKGELAMQTYNYSLALACAAAAQYLVAASEASECSLIRANAIEMISVYQLGSRPAAVKIRDQLLDGLPGDDIKEAGMMSDYLFKRFTGTCEVLDMMPQLIGLLKQARDEKKSTKGGQHRRVTEVE